MKTVQQIITDFIRDNGYDGLLYENTCACARDALIPCGNLNHDCTVGYINSCKNCSPKDRKKCDFESSKDLENGFCISTKRKDDRK